jgi:hypothetical protein
MIQVKWSVAVAFAGLLGWGLGAFAVADDAHYDFARLIPFAPDIWRMRGSDELSPVNRRPYMVGDLVEREGVLQRTAAWINDNLGPPDRESAAPPITILEYRMGGVLIPSKSGPTSDLLPSYFRLHISDGVCVGYRFQIGNGEQFRPLARGSQPPPQ